MQAINQKILARANSALRNKNYLEAIKIYNELLYTAIEPLKAQIYFNYEYACRRAGAQASHNYQRNTIFDSLPTNNAELDYYIYIEDEQCIRESGYFDYDYYHKANPDAAERCVDPIRHYCSLGWMNNRNPNPNFNTSYYLEKYNDVKSSGINPFVHWIMYGKNEGRLINVIEVESRRKNTVNCPSLIFVSHEASQTGAPAVLLTLMQWVKLNTNINFSIIVGASGPLNKKFQEIAPTFFMDEQHPNGFQSELRRFCGNHVKVIYVNTIASGLYAQELEFLRAEYVTHVHEMENIFNVFQPHVEALKRICKKYIAVSPGCVDAISKRFNANEIELKYLKPFIDKKRLNEESKTRSYPKKSIFGCGTVEKRKGFDLFCKTAAILLKRGRDDFRFYWIGRDTQTDLNAANVINLHGVNNVVEFMGVKEYPREYFSWGDLFLLPSREDPYPLVCLEAAECDMPVICFDDKAGGMYTFVENDAGAVVPYLNTEAMADAVEMFLDNEDLRIAYGKTAHQKVKDRHYVDVIAPQIMEFLPKAVEICSDIELESYKRNIDCAKVISFDIFDTLVTRKFHDPSVVFDVVEYQHTENESAPTPLFKERMETAGRVLGSYRGEKDDVKIDEIYDDMAFYKNSEIEKQTEIQMCVSHPVGELLYKYALKCGKRVIIASDMYLDISTIKAILEKNGFVGWNRLYLSSELGKKKDTGKMYQKIVADEMLEDIKPHEILHIGDNWIGDVKCAREAGLKSLRFSPIYEKDHKLFDLSNQAHQLSQIGRIWNSFSIQATRLWAELEPETSKDFYTKLGFELSGPMSAMMAMHTKAYAEEIGCKKIIFMARDGRIIKKAFDTLYSNEIKDSIFSSDYMHLSRATVIPATFEHPLNSNDLYFLTEGLHLQQKPLSYFLKKANLDPLQDSIQSITKKYYESLDIIPSSCDQLKLARMFSDLSLQIHIANAKHRDALHKYLDQQDILKERNVLLVDVGWMLNIQSRLDRFIKRLGCTTRVFGSYVGSRDRINKSISHSSLLFDCGDPINFASFIEDNVTLFELLFSSPEPSAAGLEIRDECASVCFKALQKPIPQDEFLIAQKLHFGAEKYLYRLNEAMHEFFPEQISKDYFFKLFEALVNTDSSEVLAHLNNVEILLGGHHEFLSSQHLIKFNGNKEYQIKDKTEYFKPMLFETAEPKAHVTIVTSAGLENGSTRYRSMHLADSLRQTGVNCTLIHAGTEVSEAENIIRSSDSVIFQRCFEAQGNVSKFIRLSEVNNVKILADIDDLVFPEYIPQIGSVKGGEWNRDEAMFVANGYVNLIKKTSGCITSTPVIKQYIEEILNIPSIVVRNKVLPESIKLIEPMEISCVKLIYASGTYSHKEDFDLIESKLFEFMASNSEFQLSILGAAQVSERLLSLSNVMSYPLLPYGAMLDLIAKHDLMIVPLANDIFNLAKSNVKFVECGAVGVPILASKVGEFESCIQHGINGLLAATAEEFESNLVMIARNPQLLKIIAKEAHASVKNKFTTANIEDGLVSMLTT